MKRVLRGTLAAALLTSAAHAEPPSTIHPDLWPEVHPPNLHDAALESRIDSLLAQLTVEEKVGQIIIANTNNASVDDVRQYHLGAILTGGNLSAVKNDPVPPQAWLVAADDYYAASMDTSGGKQAIPVLWGMDAVHGHSYVKGATLFPHNIGLGAARDPELIRKIARITANEVRVTGHDWSFAPTLSVVQDPRWGRTYEAYADRPDIVRQYTREMVLGLQGQPGTKDFLRGPHVIASAKHFVGDGGTRDGRDQGDNVEDERELRDVHAAAYPIALEAGVQTIMASLSSWQGRKLHGHEGLLSDVLRKRWHFDGVVVGDWNGHEQLPGCHKGSCAAAINAGVDLVMAADEWRAFHANTLDQVRSGVIPMTRLDEAVRRVLRLKLRAGLFDAGKPSSRPLAGEWNRLGAPEHRASARQAVRESLVLLKNADGLLPLRPKQRVLVAGDGADNIPKQCGGWSLTWQGRDLNNSHFPNAQSIYDGIRAAVAAAGGATSLSPMGDFSERPDVAIVVFGEGPYAEFFGDVKTLEYQPGSKRDLALLRKLRAQRIPVVAVLLTGRPLWIEEELKASDAFVVAWLPGGEGGGIADVLFTRADGSRAHDFRGRLPLVWPRGPVAAHSAQAFEYGFGLRYRAR
ncbi:MAG: glycoside hydrolase family 3 protein [Steroidobacteraceae bacterium]